MVTSIVCSSVARNRKLVEDLRKQKDGLSLFMRGELSELLEQAASAIERLEREVAGYK